MDKQKIFDKVLQHFRMQGRKSSSGAICLYRGPRGLQCAIGCLIPDELYKLDMEGRNVATVLESSPALCALLGITGTSDCHLLKKLQVIHDTRFNFFESEMESLAGYEGLRYSRLERDRH